LDNECLEQRVIYIILLVGPTRVGFLAQNTFLATLGSIEVGETTTKPLTVFVSRFPKEDVGPRVDMHGISKLVARWEASVPNSRP